ncbi:MAG: DUF115 domain-containing protein [Treponema sp.]|nr:DUF115 domain-containing protein [Treponema sp.]
MNSIWNNNIKAFKSRFPQLADLYKDFTQTEPSTNFWTIEKARSGDFTAAEKGIRLHSSYNPQREALQTIQNSGAAEKSNIIFYGFGLGWQVIEWAKSPQAKNPEKKLILIEPEPQYFFAALSILDWTQVFTIPNLIIALSCPPDQLLALIEDTKKITLGKRGLSDSYFFKIPAFINHANSYFDALEELLQRNKRKNEINEATLKKFGKLWTNNSLKNINKMSELQVISIFKDKAKKYEQEIPFLLIAAGPSLQELLPDLAELQKRCITICVETALKQLLKYNIQPDFILLTDPQFWAYKHIAGSCSPESILITDISVYPAVFRYKCKKIMLCSSQFPIGAYLEEKISAKTKKEFTGNLGSGGSVASCAWNLAEYCGAKEIFTAGLDLAFPKKQTHIKGSSAEETFHTISNRLNSVENLTSKTLYSAQTEWKEDYKNNPVLTDNRMKMFAWWFESRIASCPHVKTYTLNPQGLKIPGITPIKKEEVLSRPIILEQKKDFLKLEKSPSENKEIIDCQIQTFLQDKSDFLNSAPWMKDFL